LNGMGNREPFLTRSGRVFVSPQGLDRILRVERYIPDREVNAMKAFRLTLIVNIGLTACSTTPPHGVVANAHPPSSAGADIQCHMERPTGSMIAGRVCTTAQQRAEMDRQAKDLQHTITGMQGQSCTKSAGGC
jgi:hypothetical protein